jgi:hypothetical protein
MPQYGYLYFKLPDKDSQAAKTEWTDIKAVAGTGQAIGFGSWWLRSSFNSVTAANAVFVDWAVTSRDGPAQIDMHIRPASEKPSNPAVYNVNAGIVKLTTASHGTVINQLKEALNKR